MRSENHLKIPQLWRIPAVKNIPTSQKKAWDTRIYSTRVIFTFVDYPHVFVHLFLWNTVFLLRQHIGWVRANEVELGIWQNTDLKAMRSEPLKTIKLKTSHFIRVDTCKYQLWRRRRRRVVDERTTNVPSLQYFNMWTVSSDVSIQGATGSRSQSI